MTYLPLELSLTLSRIGAGIIPTIPTIPTGASCPYGHTRPPCTPRRCFGVGRSTCSGDSNGAVVRVVRREPEPLWLRLRMKLEVDPATGCWLWTGRCDRTGYGMLSVNGRTTCAHRAVWEVFCGPVPAGLHVLHACDRPVCCRPSCLKLGTNADNVRDREARGRGVRPVRPARPRFACVDCSSALGRNASSKGTKRCHRCASKAMWRARSDDQRRHVTAAWWRAGNAARRGGGKESPSCS